MNFYGNYKSPLGYQTCENQVDTYGVDHSGFSTRDELEYQFARQNKENQLIQNYNNQGITKNYPQYGTNFWGGSSKNNYGFGSSNIHDNIENRNNNPFENTVNTFGQSQTEQSYGLGSENQTFGQENNNSTQWGLNNTPLAQNNNNNTLSGNLFGNNNLFNQNQSVWNKNQYQMPTPWTKKNIGSGNIQPVSNKPVYENPNPRRYSTGEILWDGVKGIFQGSVSGLESLANGVTLGGYDWLDNEYGLGAKERRQNLQQAADNAGVGQAFALANQATELVGNGIGLYGIANIPSAARNAYNVYNIYKGTRNLENQLQRGNNFEDIYMGRIDRNKLDEINKIRQELGEPTIPSEKVKLLKNDIQHIWNRRIHEGGSLPKDVAHSVKQSVFSKDSQVFPGNVSRNQVMIKTGEKYPNMSIVSKDNAFDGVSIRSTMKKDFSNLLRKYPDLKH